jgi:hypothetical protein
MMGLTQALGLMGYIFVVLVAAPVFPFLYVVLRWRVQGRDDRGVGTYAALLFFASASLLVTVAGAANLAYGFISSTPASEELTRISWGMFIGAFAFLVVNRFLMIRFYPVEAHEDARRIFAGFLIIVTGTVSLGVLVMLGVTIFEKVNDAIPTAVEKHADNLKLYGSWLVFYLVSYLVVTLTMMRGAAREIRAIE